MVEEFYADEFVESGQLQVEPKGKAKPKSHQGFVQDIQKSLQQNVQAVN